MPNAAIVRLRKNSLGRWILVHGGDDRVDAYAWSGSRFVPIDHDGLPLGGIQVSNLSTRQEAAEYASEFDFKVEDVEIALEDAYLAAGGTSELKNRGNSQMYWKGRADAANAVRALKTK